MHLGTGGAAARVHACRQACRRCRSPLLAWLAGRRQEDGTPLRVSREPPRPATGPFARHPGLGDDVLRSSPRRGTLAGCSSPATPFRPPHPWPCANCCPPYASARLSPSPPTAPPSSNALTRFPCPPPAPWHRPPFPSPPAPWRSSWPPRATTRGPWRPRPPSTRSPPGSWRRRSPRRGGRWACGGRRTRASGRRVTGTLLTRGLLKGPSPLGAVSALRSAGR